MLLIVHAKETRVCFCVVRNQANISLWFRSWTKANGRSISQIFREWLSDDPVHQQHWLIVVPLLRRTKLLPVFSRREGRVVSLWQRAAGWDLSDVNSVPNKHSCQSAETVFESVEERSKQHFIWLAGEWLDEWELADGFAREKPGCLCFHIARLTFTHSRFMPGQSGPRSQPLPVFICSRKSLPAFRTTTKL